jgi:hypothetical protein
MSLDDNEKFLLGQLVAGQAAMNEKLDAHLARAQRTDDGHGARITSLEEARSKTLGIASAISAAFAVIGVWWGGHK